MNWEDLRYFLCASRCGSFLRASHLLKVSHTTVARRVQRLENTLGTRLLVRMPHGLAATPMGEKVYQSALAMEETTDALARTVMGRDDSVSGTLRITAPYLLFQYLLAPILAAFQAQFPAIEVQQAAAFERFNLTKREADVAIRLTQEPPETATGRKVGDLTWSLCMAEAHRTALMNQQTLAYFGLDDDQPVPHWVLAQFPNAFLSGRINDPALMIATILSGAGIGILPNFLAQHDARFLPLAPAPTWTVGLWVLTHRDLAKTAKVKALTSFLFERLKTYLA